MVAAQAGDRIAYEALLRGCVALIKSAAYRQGVPLDCIDDVVQETRLRFTGQGRRTIRPDRFPPGSERSRNAAPSTCCAVKATRERGSCTRQLRMRTIPILTTIPNKRSTDWTGPPNLVALSTVCLPGSAMR
jgi:hypothetical protein